MDYDAHINVRDVEIGRDPILVEFANDNNNNCERSLDQMNISLELELQQSNQSQIQHSTNQI